MNIESKLKLNNMYFNKIEFFREGNFPTKIQPNFDVKFDYINEDRIKVSLSCSADSDEGFELFVSLVGDFSIEGNVNVNKKELLEKNTTAILFPYLRSEMTLLTTQPNMPVLNIPPININALFDDLHNRKEGE